MSDMYGAGDMYGGMMVGGYGTRAGSLKSPWINYIRAERREERQTKVPRKERYKLGRIAQGYRVIPDKSRIPREDFYSERALRPKRKGGPSQNPWILFTKAARAAGDKRSLRELSQIYRAEKGRQPGFLVPVPKDEYDRDEKMEWRALRNASLGDLQDLPMRRKRGRDLDEKEEFEQRGQRGRPLMLEYKPGSGRYRPY